ncbi:MASE1 domain-containing protein [Streptomyces sp. XD-27]|uniref:MASE1 domain-containing protein n=1 Tax=Streptomyces sp. XD-27 TaxID=3062779 RepID=UPI0026F466F9|nr:MASE1 domain-containing protein [Streptomyces sp. XD-27]WKX73214.1 MASE1 domain-containing protein [Streptomyces sp. XD-27]
MAFNRPLPRYPAEALRTCVIAGAYYGSAKVGLLQELVRGQVTPLWPPTGIAVVCLLWWGVRAVPGIALGAFLVNVTIGPTALAVLGIVAGNTLAPVCGWLLLRRAGFRTEVDRLRDALALVFLAALVAMLVSATAGTAVLVAAGGIHAADFWATWSVWWTGDAMGVLVVAPVLLLARAVRWPREMPPYRWAEAAALLCGTTAVTVVTARSTVHLLFLVFPFLIWAALRFQRAGAAPCALVVSVLAISAAADDAGPFRGHGLAAQMLTLQAFNGTVAMTALLLSAVITERNRTHLEIAYVCGLLATAVNRLGPGGGTGR